MNKPIDCKLGRLFQIEYAMEAINHAGTSLGVVAMDGIVLAAERRTTGKLLDMARSQDKLYNISQDLIIAVAGITADANILIDYARSLYQRYILTYDTPMPVEKLVQAVCNVKQSYTQNGGLRPFGVSLLYAGWDKELGWQLYQSDPSGNYSGWKATCIGANSGVATSLFKSDYSDTLTVDDAKELVVKTLTKTIEASNLNSDRGTNHFYSFSIVEIAVLSRSDSKTMVNILSAAEVNTMLQAKK